MNRKMTAVLAALALFAAPLAWSPAALAAEIKLGVVDLQKAINSTREGNAAREVLDQKVKTRKDQLAPRERELKDLQDKLKSPVLSKESKAALQKDFEKKVAEFQELAGKAQYELKTEQQGATQKIMDGLIEIAAKIGKDEGFTVVMDRNASGLVYFNDALDFTDRLVKLYDEKNPGGDKKP